MMIHELKTWPRYFLDTWEGRKKFELRFNDRNFKIGDQLKLKEWDQKKNKFTGNFILANVVYVLGEFPGLYENYVIIGIEIVEKKYKGK